MRPTSRTYYFVQKDSCGRGPSSVGVGGGSAVTFKHLQAGGSAVSFSPMAGGRQAVGWSPLPVGGSAVVIGQAGVTFTPLSGWK